MSESSAKSQVRASQKTNAAPPADMLCPLAEIKIYLGVTDTALDMVLTLAGSIVTDVIRDYTGRVITKGTYTEEFREVREDKSERYLIETPIGALQDSTVGTLMNNQTGRIVLTGGPVHTVTYEGGYDPLPGGLRAVFMELVRQQMGLMGYEQVGTAPSANAPQEKAVWVGTLKVEYAIAATSAAAKAIGMGALSKDALAPYAPILDQYIARTKLAAT